MADEEPNCFVWVCMLTVGDKKVPYLVTQLLSCSSLFLRGAIDNVNREERRNFVIYFPDLCAVCKRFLLRSFVLRLHCDCWPPFNIAPVHSSTL